MDTTLLQDFVSTTTNVAKLLSFVTTALDKRRATNELVKEVNSAIYLHAQVTDYMRKHGSELCNARHMQKAADDLIAHIEEHYLSSSGFYARMRAADERSAKTIGKLEKTLKAAGTSPATLRDALLSIPKRVLQEVGALWLHTSPEHYRLELAALVTRLHSLIHEHVLQTDCRKPGAGKLRHVSPLRSTK